MSEMRVSDPSRLHLKKELTQIRKAARVLRDPGTTTSWKSPLSSSRSAAFASSTSASALKQLETDNVIPPNSSSNSFRLDSNFRANERDKRVSLYNWKTHKSMASSEKSGVADEEFESQSIQESVGESNGDGADSKSDSYSAIFRCRDSNLVSPAIGARKKSKKTNTQLDILSRYQQKDMNLRRLLKSHPSMAVGLWRDDSVEQSDDTEDYSNSSPLLAKLKQRKWLNSPSKLLRASRKEDSSYTYSTPALSASSYTRYCHRNPSIVDSWDAATSSLNGGDDEMDDQLDLPGRQGCGIPCYWSRRAPKCGSCCSPSLSDTLRRKGSSILCGRQSMYKQRRRSSSVSNKRRIASRSAQGLLPLLTYSSSIGTGVTDDELSTNYEELDLEGLSRLDGRRWSNCRSQDGLEIVALNGDQEEEGTPESIRSLSQKYRPFFFNEVIGQNIVVQSLNNAISRGKIAPVYLFQGPRGTGKTSTARIFASALNCSSTEETKPCGFCRECSEFMSGKTRYLLEVDGSNKKGVDKVRLLIKKVLELPPAGSSHYKVFLVDECHLLPSKIWVVFLKFLEEPPQRVVFVFITTDPDNVPRTVQSRCQKYVFNKVKDGDIVGRLKKISTEEGLDVDLEALDLIALNADGSLRDAETMLEQLSLLGKRITTSLVNELVGVVPDEKLLELLELSMSSDTAETVKRARDLMDSGVDPMVLMSQLASLIMDIIAGTYSVVDSGDGDTLFGGRNLTESELERLKHALKLLSEAEKQLRVSSDRSTWFTATLLQLGSAPSPDLTQSTSSWRQISRTTEDDPSSASREVTIYRQKSDSQSLPQKSGSPASFNRVNGNSNGSKPRASQSMDSCSSSASQDDELVQTMLFRYRNSEKLDVIWEKCISKCHSNTLRQLLHAHSKLFSISEIDGALAVYVAFENEDIKARAERFMSSITNSIETVLKCNVEVRIIRVPDGADSLNHAIQTELQSQKAAEAESSMEKERMAKGANPSIDFSENGEDKPELPMQRIESIIREQRLETAWLQAAEKGTPGSMNRLKPERNQVLPQEDIHQPNQMESASSMGLLSQHWEDELNHELKSLRMEEHISKRADHFPKSPSLLHDSKFVGNLSKESLGYESSSTPGGCNGLFCWSASKSLKEKEKRASVRSRRRSGGMLLFGECGKQKKRDSRMKR